MDENTVAERKLFQEQIKQNQEEDLETLKNKNKDYAQGNDPFQNFRLVEETGLTSVETGIAVRMSDKIQRIFNLLNRERAEVEDETLEDSLSDLRNYANILQVYLNWEQ